MSFFFDVVAIFAVGAAMQFIPAKAAPIHAGDLILPHQGQIQQDSVPDPGVGEWFTSVFNGISKMIAKGVKDRDPKKIKVVKEYIKERMMAVEQL